MTDRAVGLRWPFRGSRGSCGTLLPTAPSRVAQAQQLASPVTLACRLAGYPAAGCATGSEQRIQDTLEQKPLGGEVHSSAQPRGCCCPHRELLPHVSQQDQTSFLKMWVLPYCIPGDCGASPLG